MKSRSLALGLALAGMSAQRVAQFFGPPTLSTLLCTINGSKQTRVFIVGSGTFRVSDGVPGNGAKSRERPASS